MIVITFGTFDLFHIGHLNIIKKCENYKDGNNKVIVGLSSDKFNFEKKNKYPIIPLNNRMEIVKNLKDVDEVFIEESLEKKREYCLKYNADVLIMGSDHKGRFDYLEKDNIKVVYTERTKDISTSEIIDKIISLF